MSKETITLIFSFIISLGLIGFAIYIYSGDHATALGIIAFVGGHWLGIGSMATGKSLGDLASASTVAEKLVSAATSNKEPSTS
jgi:hypothetical protein